VNNNKLIVCIDQLKDRQLLKKCLEIKRYLKLILPIFGILYMIRRKVVRILRVIVREMNLGENRLLIVQIKINLRRRRIRMQVIIETCKR